MFSMKSFVLLGVFIILFALCEADVGDTCTSKSECAADECCQIINIVVMSRKRRAAILPLNQHETGKCVKYLQEGDTCYALGVLNGFCGCGQGLTCKTVHVSTTASTPTRTLLAAPRKMMPPGFVSLCAAN